MQVRCTAVSRVSDGSYDFTLADRAPLAGADILEVRIACDIAVLVVDDDRVSQFVFLAGKFHNATTRRKNRVAGLGREVGPQVVVLFAEFLAYDSDDRNHVGDMFQSALFFHGLPPVDALVIYVDLFGRRVGETVLVYETIDLVGIVLDKGAEDILDTFFQDPEGIDS